MPGFSTAIPHDGSNVPKPAHPIYVYTWDISHFAGFPNDSSLIYLKDCTLPSFDFNTESIKTGHATYEFASEIKWDDVRLTFYDVDNVSLKLQSHLGYVWNQGLGILPADEYVGDSIINIYRYDFTPAYQWKLINSWVKSVKYANMTYESSDVSQVSVVLKYTYAEFIAL